MVIIKLFRRRRPTENKENSLIKLLNIGRDGKNLGGIEIISSGGLKALVTGNMIGNATIIAPTTKTT